MKINLDTLAAQINEAQSLIVKCSNSNDTQAILQLSKIMEVRQSDLEIFDGALPIKELRETISRLSIKPHSSKVRLFAITNCENMSITNSNTLLKLLEEPPEYLKVILFTSSLAKIIATIKSRCRIVTLLADSDETSQEDFYNFFVDGSFVDFSRHIGKLENEEIALRVANTLEVMRRNGLNDSEGQLFKNLSDAYIKLSSQNVNGKLKLEGIFIDYLAQNA